MDAFPVLADPTRRRLLDALVGGPQPVNALVETLGLSQPVASKHLRILREAGLVSVKPDGQRRLYSINAAPLQAVADWLEPYRQFWSARLDALEQHLDSYPEGLPDSETEDSRDDGNSSGHGRK